MRMVLALTGGASVGVVLTTFGIGFRHGFDWDHIAAIADITQSGASRPRVVALSTLYALGHAVVVFALGVIAILVGAKIPAGLDAWMSRFVGVTLIALGVYVVVSVARGGADFRMQSRWMLLIRAAQRLVRRRRLTGEVVVEHEHEHVPGEHHAHEEHDVVAPATVPARRAGRVRSGLHRHRHTHHARLPEDPFVDYGVASATAVGMVHGVGAETPTQVLVLTTAAGVSGTAGGIVVLASFLAGLFCSNTFVAIATAFGLPRQRSSAVYRTVSVVVAVASIGMGALFLFGQDALLPALFA